MGKKAHFRRRIVVLATLFLVSAAIASAQSLDGKWFVWNCNVHSRAVDHATGNFINKNFSFKVYVHFTYKSTFGTLGFIYDCDIVCQTSPGNWVVTYAYKNMNTSFYNEHFFQDWGMTLYTKDGSSIHTYITPYLSVTPSKVNAQGEINEGTDKASGRELYGWIAITGCVAKKLPFTPQ